MAAMMVLMFVVMMGANHGFMGWHEAMAPKIEHLQTEDTGPPRSIEAPEA